MNKKGQGMLGLIGVVLVIGVLLMGFIAYNQYGATQLSIAGTPSQNAVALATASSKIGDPATALTTVTDVESNNQDKVATGIYVWDNKNNRLIADNTTSSATASTSIRCNVGDDLTFYAFGAGYYAEAKKVSITTGNDPVDVPTHAQGGWNVTFSNAQGTVLSDYNITLAANQEDSWSKIQIQNPKATSLSRLGAVAFNFSSGTNIDSMTWTGWNAISQPRRMSGVAKMFTFAPAQPIDLKQFVRLDFGPVSIKAKGSDPGESGSVIVIDNGDYKSSLPANNKKILSGLETDQPSPTDTGLADWYQITNVI